MNSTGCDREHEVLDAVMSRQWPPKDDALRAHAQNCSVCRDLVTVAAAVQSERDEVWRDARLPTSGQVWWRASMRMRAEAAATAARPITVLQGLAGACAAGLCTALVTLAWPSIERPFAWIADILSRETGRLGVAAISAAAMQQALVSVAAVVGVGLILTPLVLYFLLSND